jgi:hypothetical protein
MAGAVVIPDILGVCRVDRGLVLKLVFFSGSVARDSRLAGFPVTRS